MNRAASLALLAVALLIPISTPKAQGPQDSIEQPSETLRVFLDCQTRCDFSHFRRWAGSNYQLISSRPQSQLELSIRVDLQQRDQPADAWFLSSDHHCAAIFVSWMQPCSNQRTWRWIVMTCSIAPTEPSLPSPTVVPVLATAASTDWKTSGLRARRVATPWLVHTSHIAAKKIASEVGTARARSSSRTATCGACSARTTISAKLYDPAPPSEAHRRKRSQP